MDVLIEIHKRLPNVHLVMHGSSSVPKELQDIINQYGGKLKPTWGVPVEEIQLGIKNGVRKINVDTDNRLAITGAMLVKKYLWNSVMNLPSVPGSFVSRSGARLLGSRRFAFIRASPSRQV